MKKNLLMMLGAFAALTTSCSQAPELETPSGSVASEISFKTQINTRVVDNQFENGDVVAVVARENGSEVATAEYTFADGTFTSSDAFVYESKELSYVAAFPAVSTVLPEFSFEIAEDQSAEGYAQSDLLVATTGATAAAEPTLTFNHKLSSVVCDVVVTKDGEPFTGAYTTVVSAKNEVNCTILSAKYEAAGDVAAITPAANGESGFKVIVAPQTIAPSAVFATLSVDGQSFEWAPSKEMVLLSSMEYKYTWNVNISTGESYVTFNGLINGWGDGDEGDITPGGGSTEGEGEGEGEGSTGESFLLNAETMGYAGQAEATGTATVGGVDFEYVNVSATDTFGTTYIQYDAESYIANTSAFDGVASIVVTGNAYVKTNLVVTAGDSANPTTVITSDSADGEGWGAEYVYTLPAGTKYVKFSANSESTHDAGISSIKIVYGEGSTGGNGGSEGEGEGEGSTGTGEDFLLNAESMGYAGQAEATGTATVGGVDFEYVNVSATDTFGTTYIQYDAESYIANTSAFDGVASVVVTGNAYVKTNLVVTAGDSANPTTVITSDSADGEGWGAEYVYNLPAGTKYVKFAANSESTHDAGISSIKFVYGEGSTGGNGGSEGGNGGSEGGNGGSTGGEGESADVTAVFNAAAFGVADESNVPTPFELDGVTMSYAGGSIAARVWAGLTEMRFYKGSTITFEAASAITKVVFNGATSGIAAEGFEGGVWTGSATSVSFEVSATSKITSIEVYCGEGSTGGNGGSTGGEGGSTEGEGEGSTGEDFLLNAETMGYAGQAEATGTVTVGGVDFEYVNVSATDTFGTTYIQFDAESYIANTSDLNGATSIVVTGNAYVNSNLIVTVGDSVNPTTVLASDSADGSGWGAEYVYTLPAGTKYVKFSANAASEHDAAITSAKIVY